MPASRKRSIGTTRPKNVIVSDGRIDGDDFGSLEKITITPDWSTSSRPRDAASFASGAVLRSGRKIASSITTPKTAIATSVRTKAGGDESSKPNSPVLNAQKV
jgi:hypothetical protein